MQGSHALGGQVAGPPWLKLPGVCFAAPLALTGLHAESHRGWLACAQGDSRLCKHPLCCGVFTSSSPERSPRQASGRAQARGQLPALLAALLAAAAVLAAAALWLMRRRRAQYLLDFYAFSPPQRCVPSLKRSAGAPTACAADCRRPGTWQAALRCRAALAHEHGADGARRLRRMAVFKETYMKGVCASSNTVMACSACSLCTFT